jgi:hypothetical protein
LQFAVNEKGQLAPPRQFRGRTPPGEDAVTDSIPRPNYAGAAAGVEPAEQRFTTFVEAKADGQWVAVVHLGAGATVCKLFDSESDARHYGDELAAWLASRSV